MQLNFCHPICVLFGFLSVLMCQPGLPMMWHQSQSYENLISSECGVSFRPFRWFLGWEASLCPHCVKKCFWFHNPKWICTFVCNFVKRFSVSVDSIMWPFVLQLIGVIDYHIIFKIDLVCVRVCDPCMKHMHVWVYSLVKVCVKAKNGLSDILNHFSTLCLEIRSLHWI